MTPEIDNETMETIKRRTDIMSRVWEHYEHARKKHPYFADRLILKSDFLLWEHRLAGVRHWMGIERKKKMTSAETALLCENAEMFAAIEEGNTAAAIEEAYDAIAVLLRTIDVLEGRQPLGDPSKQSTTTK